MVVTLLEMSHLSPVWLQRAAHPQHGMQGHLVPDAEAARRDWLPAKWFIQELPGSLYPLPETQLL